MTVPVRAFIGLGANLDPITPTARSIAAGTTAAPTAADSLRTALGQLAGLVSTRLVAWSSLYRSVPLQASGPDYYNAVAELATDLPPIELLHGLLAIEHSFGRQRPYRNAPRTLDLDLLLYGDVRITLAQLQVPHPRMTSRAFVLHPLAELDASLVIPDQGRLIDWLPTVATQQITRVGPIDVMLGP